MGSPPAMNHHSGYFYGDVRRIPTASQGVEGEQGEEMVPEQRAPVVMLKPGGRCNFSSASTPAQLIRNAAQFTSRSRAPVVVEARGARWR